MIAFFIIFFKFQFQIFFLVTNLGPRKWKQQIFLIPFPRTFYVLFDLLFLLLSLEMTIKIVSFRLSFPKNFPCWWWWQKRKLFPLLLLLSLLMLSDCIAIFIMIFIMMMIMINPFVSSNIYNDQLLLKSILAKMKSSFQLVFFDQKGCFSLCLFVWTLRIYNWKNCFAFPMKNFSVRIFSINRRFSWKSLEDFFLKIAFQSINQNLNLIDWIFQCLLVLVLILRYYSRKKRYSNDKCQSTTTVKKL